MDSILIFGASGFLGRHLISRLDELKLGNIVAPSKRQIDLRKEIPESVSDPEFMLYKFDYIFLCTNWFRPGNFNVSADEFINNNIINFNVLDYWRKHQPQATLVTFGSDAAYDETQNPSEENYLVGFPNSSYYSYGLTKRFLYQGQQEIHKQTQSPYLHIPLISIFGENFNLDDEHLMHAIVKKIIRAKVLGEKASFWGNGTQFREVSFVEDVVNNIIELVLIQKRKNDIFNIGSMKRFSIRNLVKQTCDHLEYDINDVVFDPSKTVGISSKKLDSFKSQNAISDYKDTPMKECLRRVCDYYYKSLKETLLL
jgi:GDP-L-fucose synthase